MPRISAGSIAEHVAKQEAAVLDAAVRLFCQRGYAKVSLGDIAAEVGLARNSLYRYFPDKAHILVRWLQQELPAQVVNARRVLRPDGSSPVERVQRWAVDQLEYAARPEHQLIAALGEVVPELDAATRTELADSHRQLLEPVIETLAEVGIDADDERYGVAALLGGLVLAAGQHEARSGRDPALRRRVRIAISALLVASPSDERAAQQRHGGGR